MSQIPTLFALSLLIVGAVGIVFLVHDYKVDRLLLQWVGKASGRGHPPDAAALNRVAETEPSIALLRNSLAIRDADAKIRGADKVIMRTAMKLLEGSFPNEAVWATDYEMWEQAMRRIDDLVPQWAPQPHVPFLDLKYLERGAPPPPLQSNIKSDTNVMRYKAVWVAQRSYSNRREEILRFFASKAGELPG
jgi:hypothetical protein